MASACGPPAGSQAERQEARVTEQISVAAAAIGSVDGVTLYDGGYSALAFDERGQLWITTDRGPNLEASLREGTAAKRFPIPRYFPTLERLTHTNGQVVVAERYAYILPSGDTATGLPPPSRTQELDVERALGSGYAELAHDANGIDTEGLAFGGGYAWVSEEYRPSILQIDTATQRVVARFTPTPVEGYDRPLPEYLLQRQPNLGIEGLAFHDGYVYAALQGPLSPPGGDAATRIVRLLRLQPTSGEVRAYAYALESNARKIGDLSVHLDGERLLVLEHGPRDARFGGGWNAEVYAVPFRSLDALNVNNPKPPESFRDGATALINGVTLAAKELYVDLSAAGYPSTLDKPEGLAIDSSGRMLIINDNDYGIDSPGGLGAAIPTNTQSFLIVIE